MTQCVLLSISSKVHGLSVTHHITNEDNNLLSSFDFGSFNDIRSPQKLTLHVTNTSGIATSLVVFVSRFPAYFAKLTTNSETNQNKSVLLQAMDKSCKQILKQKEEMVASRLLKNNGVCFNIDPPHCLLGPFESKAINVTAYSNMWGLYTDRLTCKVDGLDVMVFPVHYGVVKSPIYFIPTATYDTTLIRLGCHLAGSNPIKRIVKFTNTSSSKIRLIWKCFTIIPHDEKLIDVIAHIGHPFPPLDESGIHMTSPLIRVHLLPHDGIPSKLFTISPEQVVLQPHSADSIEVSFFPLVDAYNEIGEQIDGYALGYMSLDEKPVTGVYRRDCYDIEPVRINVTAAITHPK
jgi:hypothetical protein